MIKKTILTFIFVSFFALSDAAIWENIPAFPQAQKVKQEEALLDNNPIQSTIYSTLSSPEEIIEFYKTKLANFGWKLKSEKDEQGIKLLNFYKEDKIVSLIVQNMIGKTFITITQSMAQQELPKSKAPCPECEKQKEELIEKWKLPEGTKLEDVNIEQIKKEALLQVQNNTVIQEDAPGNDLKFVPRYPGAVRASSFERENGKKVNLSYYSQSSIENVANFYRQNMGNYYWKLEDTIDFQNLPQGISDKVSVNMNGQTLVFKSPTASCIISITEEAQTKGTVIGVTYNER